MGPLNVLTAPLAGVNFVEAAAGTGKTHAITELYVRLLVERDIPVDKILVVTYTRAATGELRDRIRRRLVTCLKEVKAKRGGTLPFPAEARPSEAAETALERAILGFDEAAIFTIHGFCQRVLAENAFESTMPFESELLTDESDMLQGVVDDFWRREIHDASPIWLSHLINTPIGSPEKLTASIRGLIGKSYLTVLDLSPVVPGVEAQCQEAFDAFGEVWFAKREEAADLLLNSPALNRRLYQPKSIEAWLQTLDTILGKRLPDMGMIGNFPQLERLSRSYLAGESALRGGAAAPEHPVFDACDGFLEAYRALSASYDQRDAQMRRSLYFFANRELASRKRGRGMRSYDDLLNLTDEALSLDAGGALCDRVRGQYLAALVDEFQDTDPIQYRIFRHLFDDGDRPLFLVGDPKQAIYSFRGADVFAYLGARKHATHRYTLDRNYRSTPQLVAAINALFGRGSGMQRPFVLPEIDFQPAKPARDDLGDLLEGEAIAPALVLWMMRRDDDSNKITKHKAAGDCARATAIEIRRLLHASENPVTIAGRVIAPGDIAVLVPKHHHGRAVEQALKEVGVPCVRRAQESVFQTGEAAELERLLRAVVVCDDRTIKAALVTECLGVDAERLYQMMHSASDWDAVIDRFHRYRVLWQESGFMTMFRTLAAAEGVYGRLLSCHDGERRLTNLLHLAELCEGSANRHFGHEALVKWLSERIEAPGGEQEEYLVRLESDADRVRIVTVHASKGLQYPVVFCPFLWDGVLTTRKAREFVFHDRSRDNQAFVDFGTTRMDQHRRDAVLEEMAEGLRLAYVALTRAEYRCYVAWGVTNGAGASPLAWLLHGAAVADTDRDNVLERLERYMADLSDDDVITALTRVVSSSGDGAACLTPIPSVDDADTLKPVRPFATKLSVLRPRRRLKTPWQVSSFSSLAYGLMDEPLEHGSAWTAASPASRKDPLTFPRGAHAGSCLHRVFELIDFRASNSADKEAAVDRALKEFGFDPHWSAAVSDMVNRVLATPLDTDSELKLERLDRRDRIDEMEFYFALGESDPEALESIIETHGAGVAGPTLAALRALFDRAARGFMHGFIDLVFRFDDRFYLVDYKSNWLGETCEDYAPSRLTDVMAQENYTLQYLIYTVALHRYLKLRIRDYDYRDHLGGVYYLFLRGMDPGRDDATGIFRDRPSPEFIEALDQGLGAGGSSR